MRAFAQKQNQTQKPVSSGLPRPSMAKRGQDHREPPTGNRAVQPPVQAHAAELDIGLAVAASPRFEHNFSLIPIHPHAAGTLQTTLALNKPGDEFEREADRVSEQVMRTPELEQEHKSLQPEHLQPASAGQPPDPVSRLFVQPCLGPKAGHIRVYPNAPTTVARALRVPGRPLDGSTRNAFEGQFGHDFAHVRIHTDERAVAATDALRAHAFSIGEHISFAEGRYAPETPAGRQLLAHELAHVVQQTPGRAAPHVNAAQAEREADAVVQRGRVPLSARPVAVHCQPAPANTGMTRAELAKKLKAIFGHDITIEVGDKARQTKELGGPADKRKLPDTWKAWDPGANAALYDEILGAIEDFGRGVGGVPNIGHIVFYDVRYAYDDHDNVVADTKAAAEISPKLGVMFVYSAALFPSTVIAGGSGISVSGIPLATKRSAAGSKGAAPTSTGTRAESQRRTIAHELSHGVERATHSLSEFEQAVGWASHNRLFDIRAKGVKEAIKKGAEPPAAARITDKNWNSGAHLEQPMSEYAVTDSTEDFAESMMAWLYAHDALKARSPARFQFFEDQARRTGWLPKLVTPGGTSPATTPKTDSGP
jgi:Domain of unknown function (DUF4157)